MDIETVQDYFAAFTDGLPAPAASVTIGHIAADGVIRPNIYAYPVESDVQLEFDLPTASIELAEKMPELMRCLQHFISANDQYEGTIKFVLQLKVSR